MVKWNFLPFDGMAKNAVFCTHCCHYCYYCGCAGFGWAEWLVGWQIKVARTSRHIHHFAINFNYFQFLLVYYTYRAIIPCVPLFGSVKHKYTFFHFYRWIYREIKMLAMLASYTFSIPVLSLSLSLNSNFDIIYKCSVRCVRVCLHDCAY